MNSEFLSRVQRELNAEEIEGLRTYRAAAAHGSLVIMPQVIGYGESVRWECRVYLDGVSGPLRVTSTNIRAIGAPNSWVRKAESFRASLQSKYARLPARFDFQEKRGLGHDRKEIDDGRQDATA